MQDVFVDGVKFLGFIDFFLYGLIYVLMGIFFFVQMLYFVLGMFDVYNLIFGGSDCKVSGSVCCDDDFLFLCWGY